MKRGGVAATAHFADTFLSTQDGVQVDTVLRRPQTPGVSCQPVTQGIVQPRLPSGRGVNPYLGHGWIQNQVKDGRVVQFVAGERLHGTLFADSIDPTRTCVLRLRHEIDTERRSVLEVLVDANSGSRR